MQEERRDKESEMVKQRKRNLCTDREGITQRMWREQSWPED